MHMLSLSFLTGKIRHSANPHFPQLVSLLWARLFVKKLLVYPDASLRSIGTYASLQPVYQSTGLTVHRSTCLPVYRSTRLPVYRSTGQPDFHIFICYFLNRQKVTQKTLTNKRRLFWLNLFRSWSFSPCI